MLVLIILFASFIQSQKVYSSEIKIVNCKITEANFKYRYISCYDDNSVIVQFLVDEWPDQWKDSTQVGQIVKMKVISKNNWAPFPSCEARKKFKKRYTRAKDCS